MQAGVVPRHEHALLLRSCWLLNRPAFFLCCVAEPAVHASLARPCSGPPALLHAAAASLPGAGLQPDGVLPQAGIQIGVQGTNLAAIDYRAMAMPGHSGAGLCTAAFTAAVDCGVKSSTEQQVHIGHHVGGTLE